MKVLNIETIVKAVILLIIATFGALVIYDALTTGTTL